MVFLGIAFRAVLLPEKKCQKKCRTLSQVKAGDGPFHQGLSVYPSCAAISAVNVRRAQSRCHLDVEAFRRTGPRTLRNLFFFFVSFPLFYVERNSPKAHAQPTKSPSLDTADGCRPLEKGYFGLRNSCRNLPMLHTFVTRVPLGWRVARPEIEACPNVVVSACQTKGCVSSVSLFACVALSI